MKYLLLTEKEQGNGEQLYDSAASIERFHADHSKPDSNNTSSYNHGILSSQPVGSKGETRSPEKVPCMHVHANLLSLVPSYLCTCL